MPYTHKKVGDKYVVYKSGKKVGSTEGTKTALNKYLAALHIADKPKKESVKESMMNQPPVMQEDPAMQQAPVMDAPQMSIEPEMEPVDQYIHPGCDDQVGDIYVVLKPSPESTAEDVLHKTHAFGVHQFDPQTVHGVYGDEGEASLVAEGAVKDLQTRLKKIEKKKDAVLEKIVKHIGKFQKEINEHMKNASQKPEEAEIHHQLAERKMNIIKNLRDKHKVVKASKKELPKHKDDK